MNSRLVAWFTGLLTVILVGVMLPWVATPSGASAAIQDTPVPTPTPAPPTATFTPVPTATGVPAADLEVVLFGSPDPVPSGGELTYSALVTNSGNTFSGGTTLFVSLPSGTTSASLGPNCSLGGGGITCTVQPLTAGGSVGFTFSVLVTAPQGSVINASAIVDPGGLVPEPDRTNNTDSASTFVSGIVFVPTSTPPPVPVDTPTPVVIVVVPTPVPSEPAPVPPPVSPTGRLWLLVVDQTQTYGIDNSPLWIAQPGEWYIVEREEGGWALAYWEGDSPAWSVWIQEDGRVQVSIQDRFVPPADLWIQILQPIETYTPTDALAWIASPGEWYRVISQEGGWALAYWEGDPPSSAVWIQLDGRVQLSQS